MNRWLVRIAIVFGSGVVVGCSPVEPDPKPTAIEVAVSEHPEQALTLDDCIALTDKAKLTICLEQLKAQEDSELVGLQVENATKRAKLTELEKEADAAMQRLENRILESDPD